MKRLENWHVVGLSNPYKPPEWQTRVLRGNVYNDPNRVDGTLIRTSAIQSVEGRIVKTRNSEYELGTVEAAYLAWCGKNELHLPIGDNPIEMIYEF